MKFTWTAALTGSIASLASAITIPEPVAMDAVNALGGAVRRALPNSPHGYTPTTLECPSEGAPSVRSAGSRSQNEIDWIEKRRNNTIQPMRELLNRMNISNFDAGSFIDSLANNATALPNIGIAFSGGGWRALISGAGNLAAFDSRSPNSTNSGQIGGLLQSATYVAGLSGGSWLVGSIYINNFTTVPALRDDTSGVVWEFGTGIFKGPPTQGIQILSTAEYYSEIADDVNGKSDAGFNTSITDIWGRALSYQLINATNGGPAYTWSSIADMQDFQNADQPFPIVVADGRAPGETIISLSSNVYEFNPFEMGSWDPAVYGFINTQYLGTNMTNGSVTDTNECVVGFDNAGFVMGTSSSLFNQILLQVNSTTLSSTLKNVINAIFSKIDEADNDIADYQPNPFFGWNPDTNPNANSPRLTLVDGGEDLQNIPLHPLVQPERALSVIFAVDSSADTTNNWPNATALVATYERSLQPIANGTAFPSIPDQNTIVNLGLNTHPTFFGCNASNITTTSGSGLDVPLIVYIPNSPYVTYSNEPTFTLTTNDTYRDAIILNGYNVATMGNATVDNTWPTCVACAVLLRSFQKTGTDIPTACTNCYDKFCWDGTLNSTQPAPYNPTPILQEVKLTSSADGLRHMVMSSWKISVILTGVVALMLTL